MSQKERRVTRSLFSPGEYLIFWGLAAFTVACSMLLFISGADISEEVIRSQAPKVFWNVFVLSAIFTAVDAYRRYHTVRVPLNRVLNGTQKIRQGDFTTRIDPVHFNGRVNEFDVIIDDLNTMTKELAGMETLRTDFIANVSHELKTPLAVIQNYTTLLEQEGLNEEERRSYARSLRTATMQFSALITNILKLNKLENQQIFPNIQGFDLSAQLCSCLLNFESVWEEKSLNMEIQIQDDVILHSDPELLTLVWNNLLSNAMKFTPEGGTVTVRLRCENRNAIVEVQDTGCGISPEAGKHIFEKFYQGDTSHAAQGNGLGLALVKRIMDIVQGEIRVVSTSGEGSCFTVILKLEDGYGR